ncbi:hypothetical protein GOP47_0028110 [Adiantum capillus-veneris]|nr:hypothetical protein GOP47_0028110 [Adiantum capillus-veneris]
MDNPNDPATRWISFLEHNLLDIEPAPNSAEAPFWNACSENENLKAEYNVLNHDNNTKKRTREEYSSGACKRDDCPSGACGKACREKLRRDRLNDRFMELSAILEPDKPPKMDKASILRDAARILGQLRVEAQQLKDANHQLHETIRELKAEKNELRDEKTTLKFEKERLEKQLKSVSVLPAGGYVGHPATLHAAYAPQNQAANYSIKTSPYADMPFPTTMSQWMPPSTVDISNDHMLRPPVA